MPSRRWRSTACGNRFAQNKPKPPAPAAGRAPHRQRLFPIFHRQHMAITCVLGARLTDLFTSTASADLTVSFRWNGQWKASTGDTMLMSESGGVINMSGIDSRSEYRAVCIVSKEDSATATCAGNGVDHMAGDSRFIYRSTMRFNSTNDSITEAWEIEERDGRDKGTTVFQPDNRYR